MRSGQLIYKSRTMTELLLRCGFPNIQIYLSVSLSLLLSLSLLHTQFMKSQQRWNMDRQRWNMAIWRFFLRTKVSEFMMLWFSGSPLTLQRRLCSTCQGHLSSNAPTKYGSVAAGQQGFFLHPPGVTPYHFSARHRLSILSDFDSAKLFTAKLCWEF